MKKTFYLDDLCCANCAAKIERGIQKIDGVQSASISFMAQKLYIEAEEDRFDAILDEAASVIRKIEPECTIRP